MCVQAVEQLLVLGIGARPGVERRRPRFLGLDPALDELAGVADDLFGDVEVLVGVESEGFLGLGDLVGAERRTVDGAGVHLVGSGVADDGAHADERRLVGDLLGGLDCRFDRHDVFAALDRLHVPAVRLVAQRGVLAERDGGVVFDGDLVLVVEHDQVAQFLGARERGRLGRHALFDVAVGGDDVDEVVERAGTRRGVGVEEAPFVTRRHAHAHGRRESLTQWTRRDLDALGVTELGVSRRQRLPGAECFEVGEFKAESAEVELDVLREARVSTRQDEAVTTDPGGVDRVVTHDALVQRVSERSKTHRGAGVAVAHLLDGVGGKNASRIDRTRVHVGPVLGVGRLGAFADLVGISHVCRLLYVLVCLRDACGAGVSGERQLAGVTSEC